MKNSIETDVKKYKRRIKANLICSTEHSKRFLKELFDRIDDYIEQNPESDFSDIQDHFGTPEDIAKSFLVETDINIIRKKLRIKKAVTIGIIIALIIWGSCAAASAGKSHHYRSGYGVEAPAEEISRVEFEE